MRKKSYYYFFFLGGHNHIPMVGDVALHMKFNTPPEDPISLMIVACYESQLTILSDGVVTMDYSQ